MKLTLPLLFLLASCSLFAVDGTVLINQSTIAAAGGFPYAISEPGSYKLSGNLVATLDKGAIQLKANNITLDLNGFNVSCSFDKNGFESAFFRACVDDGGQARIGLTIRNGSISLAGSSTSGGFGTENVTGLEIQSSTGSTVELIRFDAGQVTGIPSFGINGGAYSIYRHNIYTNSAQPGHSCPSLVEGNINETPGSGGSGSDCVFVNNLGVF